tara:strand:+ start:1462 stop:2214 length:753 start_codon:yes stop_codon:yes gene_type:complete
MNNDLKDRVSIVTGASRGIGRSIAEAMASLGAKVVVNFSKDEVGAQQTVDNIISKDGLATLFQADVSVLSEAQELIDYALDKYGGIDILVNNAGTTRDQLILRMSEDDWDLVLKVNLKSTFNCCKAVMKPMMRKRYGRIINISSVSGIAGNAGQTNYSASKSGMIGFSKSLAREAAARNITVNVVAPGFIPTTLTNDLSEEMKQMTLANIPIGRWGEPHEVADAVIFFARDVSGYVTGQVINVDGGMVMF